MQRVFFTGFSYFLGFLAFFFGAIVPQWFPTSPLKYARLLLRLGTVRADMKWRREGAEEKEEEEKEKGGEGVG